MERKDPQTSKGKKERKARKAGVRTGTKGEAPVEISPALASLFRDFSDRSLEFSREVIERRGVAATTNNDVHRAVIDTRPPGVEYSLTEKGREVAKLGEPVFLYLRLMEGSLSPTRH